MSDDERSEEELAPLVSMAEVSSLRPASSRAGAAASAQTFETYNQHSRPPVPQGPPRHIAVSHPLFWKGLTQAHPHSTPLRAILPGAFFVNSPYKETEDVMEKNERNRGRK